jgi:hypothetical protein
MMRNQATMAAALAVAVMIVVGGCNDRRDTKKRRANAPAVPGVPVPVNGPPTLSFLRPVVDRLASTGNAFRIDYRDDDGEDVALTSLWADTDGDLATKGDQFEIAVDRAEQGGALQTVEWDTTGVPIGGYAIVAVTDDGTNAPVVVTAPGTVEIVPNVSFAHSIGSNSFDTVRSIESFADGTSVVVGVIGNPATFGAGEANETTLTPTGFDPFLARYSANGSLLWAKLIPGTGNNDDINDVAGLADGSFVVCGLLHGTTTFAPGVTVTTAGEYDPFVAKYSSTGDLVWVRSTPGAGDDWATGVAVFSDGSIAVSGFLGGSATFGVGEIAETTLVPASSESDGFVARYASDGDLAWARLFGGTEEDVAYEIVALPSGVCVLTGQFRGAVTFGAGEANETQLTSAGGTDILIAAYAADGTLAWARRAGGAENDAAFGVDLSPTGSILVGGNFAGTATFGPGEANETTLVSAGSADVFVASLEAGGDVRWCRRAGGAGTEFVRRLAAFPDGSFVLTGAYHSGAPVFGPGEVNETTLSGDTDQVAFAARFDADGGLAWARRVGGTGQYDQGLAAAAFADGTCVVGGRFTGATAVFGAGNPNETTLTNVTAGNGDAFIARFNPDGNF